MDRLQSIVVAHDLSKRADRALRRALLLAGGQGRICVVHAASHDQAATAASKRLAVRLRHIGGWIAHPATDVVVAVGDPATVMAREVEQRQAELIVIGMHRKRGLLELVGSIASAGIIGQAAVPVLMVVRGAPQPYARVLVAVDYAGGAMTALHLALDRFSKARIDALHALDFRAGRRATDLSAPDAVSHSRLEWLRGLLEEAAAARRAAGSGSDVVPLVREGLPDAVIRAAVLERRSDLLVIGAESRSGLVRLLLGSVASSLVSNPPTDLLIVPPAAT